MKIRSAKPLVFSRQGDEMLAFNYLVNSTFLCSPDLLTFLTRFDDWATLDEVAGFVSTMAPDDLAKAVKDLIRVGAVTEEGSAQAQAEEAFVKSWKWGVPAALFHFSVQDRTYMSLQEMEDMQRAKLAEDPQPRLYFTNDDIADRSLNLPSGIHSNELLQLMARRRTIRSPAPVSISLEELSDCLFAGLGITSKAENCVGSMPLGMTPSGGARNPYEAYVYARQVGGLEPGFYHYAAIDHTLARLGGCPGRC